MTDQLLSELRKMRSTRTNLGLLAGMVGLILLTVLLNGFIPKAHELADTRQPARAALGRHLGGAVRRADRRDGDHKRVPPRHDPPDVRRHAAPEPRDQQRRCIASLLMGVALRAGGDRAFVRRRLRDPRRSATSRSNSRTGHVLWLVLGTPAMTAAWAAIGVGLGAVVRNQVFAVIGLIVWAMVIDNLLRQPRSHRSAATRRAAPALRSSPTPPTTYLRRPPAGYSCSATSPPSSPPVQSSSPAATSPERC